MPLLLTSSASSALPPRSAASFRALVRVAASADADAIAAAGDRGGFPPFLPREVERIRDGAAVRLAKRIERVPVQTGFSKSPILSSCVRPLEQQQGSDPVVLLHGFDSSCLEWTYTYPLLEEAGLEAWAVDILGWGFSDLETRPPCDVVSKREHLYQVSKLIFIGASVYSEGPKYMTRMPIFVSYAGVSILKSLPLRLFATHLAFNNIPGGFFDWLQISRLHCLLPWWEDATVDFMIRGGYNVINQIKQVKHKCLILWGEDDGIISSKLAYRLHQELPDAILRQVPQCGHIPHVEKPREVAKHVLEFLARSKTKMSYRR
ncbi:alpha/beta hydrolase domain-containing protein VTE7-like isoform X3 [Phragmites australis]|uniref:alpha/beta hydrolase domain-containing protein VTE7-like isoform X3 n=1 Tax=Phragmites australis TaxID=29695 RepID=UPI002D77B95F|nr:alpha/beta hydrolase domain-containing protein VTE7-like isoform X3 [Phragmites australis]